MVLMLPNEGLVQQACESRFRFGQRDDHGMFVVECRSLKITFPNTLGILLAELEKGNAWALVKFTKAPALPT